MNEHVEGSFSINFVLALFGLVPEDFAATREASAPSEVNLDGGLGISLGDAHWHRGEVQYVEALATDDLKHRD